MRLRAAEPNAIARIDPTRGMKKNPTIPHASDAIAKPSVRGPGGAAGIAATARVAAGPG
jgi:hypothetical protein